MCEGKNQYFVTISKSQKHVREKLHYSALLEFELTDMWLMAGKQHLRGGFNEPFEMSLIYFETRG